MKEKCTPEENAEAMSILRATFPVGMSRIPEPEPELPDYEIAKRDCLSYIADLGITAEIRFREFGEDKDHGRTWEHRAWDCNAKREKRDGRAGYCAYNEASFDDYKTGMGIDEAPDVADILGSYARDYVSANNAGSFEDWASDLGYDTDSRKAEESYRACLAQRKPLMQLGLSMDEIEKIAEYASQF